MQLWGTTRLNHENESKQAVAGLFVNAACRVQESEQQFRHSNFHG
jgi:hypothetical protein